MHRKKRTLKEMLGLNKENQFTLFKVFVDSDSGRAIIYAEALNSDYELKIKVEVPEYTDKSLWNCKRYLKDTYKNINKVENGVGYETYEIGEDPGMRVYIIFQEGKECGVYNEKRGYEYMKLSDIKQNIREKSNLKFVNVELGDDNKLKITQEDMFNHRDWLDKDNDFLWELLHKIDKMTEQEKEEIIETAEKIGANETIVSKLLHNTRQWTPSKLSMMDMKYYGAIGNTLRVQGVITAKERFKI